MIRIRHSTRCTLLALGLLAVLLASCASVELNASIPTFETGVNPDAWVQIPEGEFYFGQHEEVESTAAYEIMVTDVTVEQYANFLIIALADGSVKLEGDEILGYYPGDVFRGVKHEEEITAGDWMVEPLPQ